MTSKMRKHRIKELEWKRETTNKKSRRRIKRLASKQDRIKTKREIREER